MIKVQYINGISNIIFEHSGDFGIPRKGDKICLGDKGSFIIDEIIWHLNKCVVNKFENEIIVRISLIK